ncbi:WD repeat-containing protein 76 isoform X2 [Dunckerocampus dactyliophorus]|uniref:WD repeat-containing protein 76 isoform X2 n=1 Tax=Dunckerocampus dactyliophorus TaxID=161453 RepID=UPI0024063CD7|nr:WD repeat-containing protein 76 isoform X2 [Dunckerocampus dactyliophorus]
METRLSEHQPADKEMTPVQVEGVRKSSRKVLAPKRLRYSPAALPPPVRRKPNIEDLQREEEDSSVAENSGMEVTNGEGLSAYELERLENIRQNQAFLSAINLFQASEELKQSSAKRQPSQRGLTSRSHAEIKEVLPPRKSLRLQNKQAEVLTLPPEPRGTSVIRQALQLKKPAGPLSMTPVNMAEGSKLPPQLLKLCSDVSPQERRDELNLSEYCSSLRKMTISEEKVAKVVKDRIFSAAFHPSSTSLLMAAGDKWGKVGLWSLGGDWGDDGVLLFEPHTRPVGCLAFSRAHPAQLLSLSYDGSMRCMDMEKTVFDEVYDIKDGLKTFDFLSHDCLTLVVGDWYGNVAMVDRRTPGTSHESLHSLDPKVLRCVSVHPLQQQYFAVAVSKEVNIYDSRSLKKSKSQPVCQLRGHSLSISSCYFSPCTGDRVVTSCMDNHIRIFDTSALTSEAPLLTSIRHNMQTGRWLSKLSAVWDPKQENCLMVGSVSQPRNVQVFHESGRSLHIFKDDKHLNTVLSVTAFHPCRKAFLGGNASGRLHIFSD